MVVSPTIFLVAFFLKAIGLGFFLSVIFLWVTVGFRRSHSGNFTYQRALVALLTGGAGLSFVGNMMMGAWGWALIWGVLVLLDLYDYYLICDDEARATMEG